MNETLYAMNDVVFFVHGHQVVKGIIDEIIMHYTQKNIIVKYIIRPYGLKDYVTINEDKIYKNIDEAKDVVIQNIKNTYTKGNIIKNYESAKRQVEEMFQNRLDSFDEEYKKTIENIESINEEYYDNLEKFYKENQTEEKNESDS